MRTHITRDTQQTHTNTLLLTYLQFRFMELPVFSLATLVEVTPLKGVGIPRVNQSGDRSFFRRSGAGSWAPGTKAVPLGFTFLGFRVFDHVVVGEVAPSH